MGGNEKARVYVLDTSVWLAMDSHPDSNLIPSVLDMLLAENRIKSPKQVFSELKRVSAYSDWAKNNRRKIGYPNRMNADYMANVGLVQHTFPGMGKALGSRERAEPWVVAAALTENSNGNNYCVVAAETLNNRPNRKIPGVCASLGIDCITLTELLDTEGDGEDKQ